MTGLNKLFSESQIQGLFEHFQSPWESRSNRISVLLMIETRLDDNKFKVKCPW